MWVAPLENVVVMTIMMMVIGVESTLPSSLVDQGYNDIVVGISPLVDESQAGEIIDAIKVAVNETSHMIFKATGNRLFFRNVKILVPKNWNTIIIDQPSTNEVFEESHIRVDKMNPVYGDQVYTDQPGKCGEPGRYIHITPEYLTNKNSELIWGPTGKVLAQSFAKLRWGIYEEIGYPNDLRFPLFYRAWSDNGVVVMPNHCSQQEISGEYIDVTTMGECTYVDGLPDKNCRFYPDYQQKTTSSLMSFAKVDTIETYCKEEDDEVNNHNPDAPNRHNLMCNGRSVWDVMLDHQDFYNVKKLPANHPVSPEVVVVQQTTVSFALVLDYSTSMQGTKINVLVNTAKRWLMHDVADGSFVTIIKFSSSAFVASPLTKISDTTRQTLADVITAHANGGTCIGCGLNKAIEEMKNQNNKVILLITDGGENQSPKINDVMKSVVNSNSRVITISYGKSAEKTIEVLAQSTGGKSYIVPDNDDGNFMIDAFQGSLTYQPGKSIVNTNIKIYEWTGMTNAALPNANSTFLVDFTVGRNLEFRMDTSTYFPGSPYLTSPSGKKITDSEFFSNMNLWIIRLGDNLAEVGKWTWTMPNNGQTSNVKVTVTAQARDQQTLPIMTESWINTESDFVDATQQRVVVYARVTQGNNPVVGAKVKAYITTPLSNLPAVQMELRDNGQGADVQTGDGIYSHYFTQFNSKGRYAVKAQVWDEGSAFINNGFLASKRRRRRAVDDFRFLSRVKSSNQIVIPEHCCGSFVPFDPETAVPTGRFTRSVAAGSFNVVTMAAAGDSFPPDQVRDVSIFANTTRMSVNTTFIKLSWTAPGDDYDTGMVSGYEIWMSTNRTYLRDDIDTDNVKKLLDFSNSSKIPDLLKEGGEEVTYEIELDEELEQNKLYYLALRAEDEAGNISPMSRPVEFFMSSASGGVTLSGAFNLCSVVLLILDCFPGRF